MKMHGDCMTRVFQRLTTVLALLAFLAAPAYAHLVKWRHGLLQAKGNSAFFWMPLEKGYFKKRGLDVKFIQFRGDKDVMRALLAGDIDSAGMSPGAALNAIDRGADLRFIGSGQPGFPYALYVRKDITSWEQLKGKTFGVSAPGGVPDIMAREMLRRKGIDPSSIKIVNAGSDASRIKALVAGKIDATASASQHAAIADKLGIRVMAFAADLVPEYPATTFVAKESTLKAKPEAAISFLAAYMEGLDYAVTHRDEALKLAGKMTGKPANDPELVYTYDEAIAKKFISVKSEIPRAKIEWLQNVLLKQGTIRKKIDIDKYIDETYRRAALERVHLSSVNP